MDRDNEQLQRYSRQMILPQIGEAGQQALQDAHILIIGMGGLGSPAAQYLAAAGVGTLSLCDFDRVSISNLHRQVLYTDQDLGHKKTQAAKARLQACNPALTIHTIEHKMTEAELAVAVEQADIVLDCSDNFSTRYAVNAACVAQQTPLVSGAAIRLEGQVAVFNRDQHSPCYACLYADAYEEAARCSEVGVLGPLVGVIGSMQALEAIKLLADFGEPLSNRLLIFDAAFMEWRSLKLNKDPACKVCGAST